MKPPKAIATSFYSDAIKNREKSGQAIKKKDYHKMHGKYSTTSKWDVPIIISKFFLLVKKITQTPSPTPLRDNRNIAALITWGSLGHGTYRVFLRRKKIFSNFSTSVNIMGRTLNSLNSNMVSMPKAKDGIKICTKCKCAKPVTEFNKDKTKSDGLMSICIMCKRAYRISPFYKARERELEKTPRYQARKCTPKEKFAKSVSGHTRRTRNSNVSGSHDLTFVQWECILINQDNKCAICRNNFSELIPPTRDCIIPISKGGFLTLDNTQALCKHCNAVKHSSMYSGLGNRWRSKIIN